MGGLGERRRLEKQLGRAERRAQRTNATEDWDRMLDLQRQLTVLEQQEVQWQSERAKHFLRVFGAVPSRRITAHFKWRRRAEGVTDDLARDLQTNMAQLYAPAAPPASADGQHERARANFLRNPRSPLSEEARAALEADVTRAEAAEAIQGLRGDSCGGADGISPALLKACQGTGTEAGVERVVAYFVNKLLRGEGHDGRLANAAITLIHKGGSRTDWRRYRPISLLSVLYKASAKVLTARLLRVMPQLVHEDQLGFVPGRDIGTAIYSLHLLDELMRIRRQSAWAVLVDFEQAYDTAFRGWAADAMAWGGLPPRFVKAAVALQSDSRASLVLNGAAGEPFPLNRGVKQGCPLSPLIFVLAVEPLAERLRAWGQEPVQLPGGPRCDRVLGIRTTGGRAETLLAFADDFNVLLQRLVGRDRNQLDPWRELAEVLRDFHRVSGLKASQTKTKLYRLGRINKRQEAKAAAQGCPWGVEPGGVRLLGAQTREQAALVWPGRLGEALRRADAASSLGLPIRGRARVANAYITSLAGYHLEMSPAADHSCVADLRRVQERYVLNARSAGQVWFRVGRIMLTAPPEEGGLGALPLDAHTAARRLRHLARALITKRVGAHGQLGGLAGILTACLEGLGAGRLGLLPFSLPETDGCHVAQLIESRRLQGKLPALESFCDAIKGLGSLRATLGPAHAPPPLAPTTDEVARQRWTGLAAEGRLTLNFDGGSRGNGSDTSTAGAGGGTGGRGRRGGGDAGARGPRRVRGLQQPGRVRRAFGRATRGSRARRHQAPRPGGLPPRHPRHGPAGLLGAAAPGAGAAVDRGAEARGGPRHHLGARATGAERPGGPPVQRGHGRAWLAGGARGRRGPGGHGRLAFRLFYGLLHPRHWDYKGGSTLRVASHPGGPLCRRRGGSGRGGGRPGGAGDGGGSWLSPQRHGTGPRRFGLVAPQLRDGRPWEGWWGVGARRRVGRRQFG